MLKLFLTSLKFVVYYTIFPVIFCLIIKYSILYNDIHMPLNLIAIALINFLSFYQGIKATIINSNLEKKDILRLLGISFVEIEVLTFLILYFTKINGIIIFFSLAIVLIEFLYTYIYMKKEQMP